MKEIELAGLKFWITADDKKIDFDLKDVTSRENDILKNNHSVYFMERAVVLVPNLPDSFSYKKLSLESNKNWSKMEGDTDGDEWFYNIVWYWKDKAWSVGIHIENDEYFDEITCITDGLPYYLNIDQSVKNELCFEIIYKDRKEYEEADFSYMKWLDEGSKKKDTIKQDLSLWWPMDAMHEILKS